MIVILTPARAAHTREQTPAVHDRIRSLMPEMPAAVARVAAYLLEHPQAPLTLSIGELADQAGASPATVTRFCRTIGYPGYVELSRHRNRCRPQRVTRLMGNGDRRRVRPGRLPGGPAAHADRQPHEGVTRGDVGH